MYIIQKKSSIWQEIYKNVVMSMAINSTINVYITSYFHSVDYSYIVRKTNV